MTSHHVVCKEDEIDLILLIAGGKYPPRQKQQTKQHHHPRIFAFWQRAQTWKEQDMFAVALLNSALNGGAGASCILHSKCCGP